VILLYLSLKPMTASQDTIVAVATPSGRGGVGIIRVSGTLCQHIAKEMLGRCPPPRTAIYTEFKAEQDETLDSGIALYFPAPHSFTGEHVLEFQGHGGPVVLDRVLKRCLSLGARLARAGEFSERAFLNDKMDLAQAEAVADLIDSSSEEAARSALRSLQGHFSAAINELLKGLIELRVYVEAALDFPDEEIDFLADKAVTDRLDKIKHQLHTIFSKAKQGSLLREGMQLVIVGKPNAGKSSLLNALSGSDRAIVTEVAGTTRDVLRETIHLDGMPLHIIDTAGLRDSDDPVEKIGIERAWQEIEKADLILLLIDETDDNDEGNQKILQRLPASLATLQVHNKIDLTDTKAGQRDNKLYISAKQQLGITELKQALKHYMGYQSEREDSYIARRRHLQALTETQQAVNQAEIQLKEYNAGELMAEELRIAQNILGQITGRYTPDDLLGEIFSNFCIGK
jgi:tRNA modification GTPase